MFVVNLLEAYIVNMKSLHALVIVKKPNCRQNNLKIGNRLGYHCTFPNVRHKYEHQTFLKKRSLTGTGNDNLALGEKNE